MNFKTEWDLPKYFYTSINDPQIDIDIKQGFKECREFYEKYRQKPISQLSDEDFLVYLKESDEYSLLSKVAFYLSFLNTLDTQDQAVLKKDGEFSNLYADLSTEGLFIDEEYKKIGAEDFMRRAGLDLFSSYKNYLTSKAESLKYFLEESTEKAIITLDQGSPSAIESMYSELTSSFVFKIKIDGYTRSVTDAEIRSFREDKDPAIREKAYKALYKIYGSKDSRIVLGNIYKGIVKDCIAEKKLRNYPSVMFSRNSSEELSDEIVNHLIKTVRDAFPLYQRFLKLKAKKMGVKKLSVYDFFAPITNSSKEFPFQEGFQKYLDIIKTFDQEFFDYSKEIFENGRVDVFPKKGKMGGAYANYDKDCSSFVMLNYTNKFSDVMTLAHELGHAIHGHLSQKQVSSCYGSPLSLAETASIFNETLVFEKFLEEGSFSEEQEVHYRFEQLEDIFATTFRQIQYVLFEKRVHEAFDRGEELSHQEFNIMWREAQVELTGDAVEYKVPAKNEFGWSSIPHIFHTPFYCYSYSFGNLLSLSLYKLYKKDGQEFVERYKNILRAGGSERPEQLLLKNGVNINDESFFKNGITMIEELLEKLEEKVV